MSFTEVQLKITPPETGIEILIAQLSNIGFESFYEENKILYAYIKKEDFSEDSFLNIQIFDNSHFSIKYSVKSIPNKNWNQAWENNFKPVYIGTECVIRATFHNSIKVPYEIVIDPKMSFGTGHHSTTYLMLEALLHEKLNNMYILDMGCGTGVLSILSSMRGAKSVLAIDKDDWCYENSIENINRNNCNNVRVKKGSMEQIDGHFDMVLANINRNILIEHMPVYTKHLLHDAVLYCSGFYLKDLKIITEIAKKVGLVYAKHSIKNDWVCAKFVKSYL